MNKLLADYAKKPVVPVGQVNGSYCPQNDVNEEFSSTDDEQEDYMNYEKDFVEEEMKRYAHCMTQADSVRFSYYLVKKIGNC